MTEHEIQMSWLLAAFEKKSDELQEMLVKLDNDIFAATHRIHKLCDGVRDALWTAGGDTNKVADVVDSLRRSSVGTLDVITKTLEPLERDLAESKMRMLTSLGLTPPPNRN